MILSKQERLSIPFRFDVIFHRFVENPAKAADATVADEQAAFSRPFALFLDSPVSVVADASRLANHQIGGGQDAVDAVQTFFESAIMVEKTPARLFDQLAISVHRPGASTNAEYALAGQPVRGMVRVAFTGMFHGAQLRDHLFGMTESLPQMPEFVLATFRQSRQRQATGSSIAGATQQALSLLEIGQTISQLLELSGQRCDPGVASGQIGTQFCDTQAECLCLAGFSGAQRFAFLAGFLQLSAQLDILVALCLDFLEVGSIAGTQLMLNHVNVSVNFVFKGWVARRVRPDRPKRGRNFGALRRSLFPQGFQGGCFLGGGEATDGRLKAFFQLFL